MLFPFWQLELCFQIVAMQPLEEPLQLIHIHFISTSTLFSPSSSSSLPLFLVPGMYCLFSSCSRQEGQMIRPSFGSPASLPFSSFCQAALLSVLIWMLVKHPVSVYVYNGVEHTHLCVAVPLLYVWMFVLLWAACITILCSNGGTDGESYMKPAFCLRENSSLSKY